MWNDDYESIRRQSSSGLEVFDHYWLDMADPNNMIRDLSERLSVRSFRFSDAFSKYRGQKHNTEKLVNCSFGFPTQMMHALKPSKAIYKDFLLGRIWSA